MYVIGHALPEEFQRRVAEQLAALGVEFVPKGVAEDWRLDSAGPRPWLVIAPWREAPEAGTEDFSHLRAMLGSESLILAYVRDESMAIGDALTAGADDCVFHASTDVELRLRLQVSVRRAQDRLKWLEVGQQLRASIERFDLAVEGANEGLWDARPMGKPWHEPDADVWYSSRFKELLGFGPDEFPHTLGSWETLVHPDDLPRVLEELTHHIGSKVPYDTEYRMRNRAGEYRWFCARGKGVWDDEGRLMRMAGSLRDITETKHTEERLLRSETKWRTLVQNAPALIVVASPEGVIEFVNRDSEMANQAIGKSVYEFTEPAYHAIVRDAFRKVVTTGKPQRYEARGDSETGGVVWYSSRLGPLVHNDVVESVVLIAIDITRRKNAEALVSNEREHLRRLLDLQERERQIVAYEIHDGMVQYLAGGIMHLEAFASRAGLDEEATHEYERGLGLLRESLAEARRLISGLRPPVLDELGVVAALEYLVNESRQWIAQIDFQPSVHFDRLVAPLEVAIFRVAQEALSNIRKHSAAPRASIELRQHGNWVRLYVRDWGLGFDPAVTPEERFGLQGIRQRARLLGTVALIESIRGEGTAITVDFPLVERPEPNAGAAGWKPAPSGHASTASTSELEQLPE